MHRMLLILMFFFIRALLSHTRLSDIIIKQGIKRSIHRSSLKYIMIHKAKKVFFAMIISIIHSNNVTYTSCLIAGLSDNPCSG